MSPVPTRPRILIVDDDFTMRFLVREALESQGYEMVEAVPGDEAIATFEALRPELVILDLGMGEAAVYDTLERIRALPAGARTPVVMTTDSDDWVAIDRAFGLGATDFIAMPIRMRQLAHRLQYILKASRTAEALADHRGRLAEVQRVAKLGRWEWDFDTDRIVITDEVSRLLGAFEGTLAAFLDFVDPEDRETVRGALQASRDHGVAYECDHRLLFPGGGVRFVNARGTVTRNASGTPVALSGMMQNITNRKAMESRLVETERLSAMGEMAGEIGHELNNYLMAISGRAELIPLALARNDLAKVEHSARVITDQVVRMRVLTDGLLDAARSESSPSRVDLRESIDRILEFVKPQNKYDDVTFDLDCGAEPLPLHADPQQIQQVLLNLLSNAADAVHAREGSTRRVRVCARREGGGVCLTVTDDGVGIDSVLAGRIFEPRFTTKAAGNGFGLAVCHRIVKNHGGEISFTSTPGSGSTFQVVLPSLAPTPALAPTEAEAVRTSD